MNFRRKRRAISYIMEVVMMTLVITALATVVLTWGLSTISSSRAALTGAVNARMDRVQEALVVVDVQLVDPTHLRVWIRNTGSIQIVIDQIYVNNSPGSVAGTCAPGTPPPIPPTLCSGTSKLSLPVGAAGAIDASVAYPVSTCTITTTTTTSTTGTTMTATITTTTSTVSPTGLICGGNSYLVEASTSRGTSFTGSFTV